VADLAIDHSLDPQEVVGPAARDQRGGCPDRRQGAAQFMGHEGKEFDLLLA